jgi:hypothetical protein
MRLQKVIRFPGQLLLMALPQFALAQNGSLNGFDDYVQKARKEWEGRYLAAGQVVAR